MAFRNNYWSCSKFADWLRGSDKPNAATSKEWREWQKNSKKSHPFRYWLAEKGLNLVQDTISWPIDRLYDIKYYINNRWVTKTHCLTAHPRDIEPGTWCDVGNRFLPCLFNELVDFVEIEQAWHYVMFSRDNQVKYKTPWWAKGWFRWRTWRCPEAGVAYLKWASSLSADESWGLNPGDEGYGVLTHQARSAREILELYTWWKEVYPNRPDPMDASGWTDYCEKQRELSEDNIFWDEETDNDREKTQKLLNTCSDIEERYHKEDEEMLIRLIKIRRSLWT